METNEIFDTRVQEIKYKVLKEIISSYEKGTLNKDIIDIPKKILPGKVPTFRCCIYKERAILSERIKIAMGVDREHVIQTIGIACDECPSAGYEVTDFCRGCIGHMCYESCKFGAITVDENHHSHIDKMKCKNCGMCAKACPYSAIINRKRPCQKACKIGAIDMNEDLSVKINYDKCISCGACVYQCPFGALQDTSYILDVLKLIKEKNKKGYKIFALVAPAIASQWTYVNIGQIATGLKKLGFDEVYEVASGADMVAKHESKEFVDRGFLFSSCCPSFVKHIENKYPDLSDNISSSLSPMAELGKFLKHKNKDEKIKNIFIGPCTAKKEEIRKNNIKKYIDDVITFEELKAWIDAKDLHLTNIEESEISGASYFGRIFARCGGLSEAIKEGLKEMKSEKEVNALSCNGIEECDLALMKKSKNILNNNFVEGMACVGGCTYGAGCLRHDVKNKMLIDAFGKTTKAEGILDAVNEFTE